MPREPEADTSESEEDLAADVLRDLELNPEVPPEVRGLFKDGSYVVCDLKFVPPGPKQNSGGSSPFALFIA